MELNGNEISKEMILSAKKCKNADELIEKAKEFGIGLTKDEAEAYIAELNDIDLDEKTLDKVAGGVCWTNCPKEAECPGHLCGTVGWESTKGC